MDPKVLDPVFSRGLKLLLSSDADAADQLRNLLDDALRQKYGPSKMISAVMPHKKVTVLLFLQCHFTPQSKTLLLSALLFSRS